MTARIDHEQEALDAAAAGKYDIAQYHATMLVAERLAPVTYSTTIVEDVAALRVMMGRD